MKEYKRITVSECAYDGKLALDHVFCVIQDSASAAFGAMSSDNYRLREKYHAMWVFTKNRTKVFSRPEWNDKILSDCRIVGKNKFRCFIKTDIYSETGNKLIESVIEACCLDTESFAYIPLENIPLIVDEEEFDGLFRFTEFISDDKKSFTVTHNLVDMSVHMNNAKALIPFAESLSFDEIKEIYSSPFEIAIKYVSQAMIETPLILSKKKTEEGYLFRYDSPSGVKTEIGYLKKI